MVFTPNSTGATAKRPHDPILSSRNFALLFIIAILIVVTLLLSQSALAATRTWDGGTAGNNDNWDTVLNWDNDALPANTDDVVFGTGFASGTTISLNGARTVNSFTINTTTGFTISANTLTITSGTLTRNDVTGTEGNHTIASAITLGANGLWTINGAGTLTFSSAIGDGVNTFGLTKDGTGTLVFSAAMTYDGDTTITAGTLQITVNAALSGTGDLQIDSAGTLGIGGTGATVKGLSGTGLVDHNVGGTDTLTLGNNNASGNFSGIIANSLGTLNVTKAGTGTQILSGANSYTGSTTVSAGVLNIQNNTGLGTVAGDVSVSSGAALELQGTIAVGAEALTLAGTGISNGGALRNVSGNNSWGGAITIANTPSTTRINSDSGTLTIGGNIGETGGTPKTLAFGGTGNTTVNGIISESGTDLALAKDGAGILTLTNANTYSQGTTISAGTLLANNTTGSGTGSGNVTVNGSGTTLGGTGTISGTVTLGNTTPGAILNPGPKGTAGTAASVGTLTTGALTLTGANTFHVDAFGTATTEWDKLVSTAAITLGTISTLDVTIASSLNFTPNTTYVLLNGTTLTGTFSGITDGQTVTFSGYQFIADYTTTGFDLVAVPEPSTWIAGGLALAALAFTQRRILKKLRVVSR